MDGKEILIADDDHDLLQLLRQSLEGLGLRVRQTHDAVSALMLAHEHKPDLLILDIHMPGGNGLSVCEMLNSDPLLSHMPVIILTGQSDERISNRCQAMGAHYVCKGVGTVDRIHWLVRRLLGVGAKPAAGEVGAEESQFFVG